MNTKQWLLRFAAGLLVCCGLSSVAQAATTYYIRTDGGTDVQCTGKADAPYSGSGTGQACAFSHPFFVLSPAGSPSRMVGGDTMIIGPGQYMMGFGAPNTPSCSHYYPWDCSMRAIPSGTVTNPTRILGKGFDNGCASKPQLWGTERSSSIIDLRSSSHVQLQCLELTDHSSCMDSGPDPATVCNRSSYPYGPWASRGIVAADSQNVLIKNIYIHGLWAGVLAGRLKDWIIENTDIFANSFVGWDGDIGATASSNSGTIMFKNTRIKYSGCGETYPGLQRHHCYSQDQGGYGDGLGTHKTDGNWIFDRVDISYNVSDGLDLLYHSGNGSISIKHSRFEGNAGNQIKLAAPASIENSKLIGTCAYFKDKSFTSTTAVGGSAVAFNNCRALGNTIALSFRTGMQVGIYNSTITGNGDVLVESSGPSCLSTDKVISKNNIYHGGPEFHTGGQDLSDLYYAAGAGGNGDGSCGTLPFISSNDIIWGTKNNSNRCNGNGSKCVDPKMVGALGYNVEDLDVSLQSVSPAIKAGVIMTNVAGTDYNFFDRGAAWDIGSLEYGSIPSQQNVPPSVCGNGVVESGEQCDGTNLGGLTCASSGFSSGTLSCSSTCMLNTSGCITSAPVCGNGILDPGEQCDGANLDDESCTKLDFAGGTLFCSPNCTFDTTQCSNSLCGNGLIDPGEQCDGANLDDESCTKLDYAGGTLSCLANCTFNLTACIVPGCGNGLLDPGEQCDGANLDDESCVKLDFADGTLSCSSNCTFNTTKCVMSVCGNGTLESGEQCDGSNLNGQTCALRGFAGGSLGCSNCAFDISNCLNAVCGNGKVETGEKCDGANMNNQTCANNGFAGGQLSCTNVCTLNTTSCLISICGNGIKEIGETCDDANLANNDGCSGACRSEYCGDGIKQTKEQCDDGNLVNGDGCSALCLPEGAVCGNGVVDAGEICDDGNLSNNDGCSGICKKEYCGDGIKQANEGCDDGNWTNTDGCSALCKIEDPFCGNGVLDSGEVCDDGNIANNDGCSSVCFKEYCGDGIQQSSEGCDDRNTVSNDGCSSSCVRELSTCGNGIKEGTEKCDDGNLNNNDGCSNLCKFEYCGDGIKQTNEGCDDGNWKNRDGCSALCRLERKKR